MAGRRLQPSAWAGPPSPRSIGCPGRRQGSPPSCLAPRPSRTFRVISQRSHWITLRPGCPPVDNCRCLRGLTSWRPWIEFQGPKSQQTRQYYLGRTGTSCVCHGGACCPGSRRRRSVLGVHAYTIVSRAYVPQARVLARSFSEHHPDGQFWALLIDDVKREINEADEPFRALRLGDLDVDPAELHRMAMLFGNRLIAAIKPWAFEHFLRNGVESIIYIDSDFMIFESLQAVVDNATEHGVV